MTDAPPRGEARTRILETAWNLIAAEGAGAATLVRVARGAGVSRQSVYLFFGGRAGLLDETLRWQDAQSEIRLAFLRATRLRPAPAAFRAVLETWFAYQPVIDPVARAMEAAAATDADAARAWASRMDDIRGVYRAVLRRIDAEGSLAPGWSVETATDFTHALAHPGTWRRLVAEAGWPQDTALAAVAGALATALLTRDVSSRG